MALEIERKFLVKSDSWRTQVISSSRISQGYLTAAGTTVRVRLRDDEAYLTIKGKAVGIARCEYEYPIPVADAVEMLENTLSSVQKKRTGFEKYLPSAPEQSKKPQKTARFYRAEQISTLAREFFDIIYLPLQSYN